jgi:AraC-like DNA-binding protein
MSTGDVAGTIGGISVSAPPESFSNNELRQQTPTCPISIDLRIRQVKRMIRRDIHQPLRLAELARCVNLSESRLSHLFRMETGVCPGRYQKSIRLQEARKALEESSRSIKEIAALVGLAPSRLAREFRTAYRLTPREYRVRFGNPRGEFFTATSAQKRKPLPPARPTDPAGFG